MVKLALFSVGLTASLSAVSLAQIPTPTGFVIPSDAAAVMSSLIKNPLGAKSILADASNQVSLLPSQYQASAYSALARASQSVSPPKDTPQSQMPQKSTGNSVNSYKPMGVAIAFISMVFGACVIL